MRDSALSPDQRSADLAALERDQLDLLVIGGGVVGAGTALDAAARGLRVGLVEANDWASGTSSHSTKLIHGGLRYLKMLDFALVREALTERALLLERIAPHLVHELRFTYPLRRRVVERLYTAAGIAIYDALGRAPGSLARLRRQRQRTRAALYRENPGLRHDTFCGAIEYRDAQVDDARLVLALVRTAAAHGASVVSYARATDLVREQGRVVGARLRDEISGLGVVVRARSVVVATGPWPVPGARPAAQDSKRVRPSKGVHLVVPLERIPLAGAVITETARSVLFVIPWGAHWLIGTTDTPWSGGPDQTVATAADIAYLLDEVNAILQDPISEQDVTAVYAGLRPLVAAKAGSTTKLSREHAVDSPEPGLAVVSGGKLTTYRVMASDTVDVATSAWEGIAGSSTRELSLVGAAPRDELAAIATDVAERWGLGPDVAQRLVARYGTTTHELLAPAGDEPGLLASLPGGDGHIFAEVRYAATAEGALALDDVVRRRLRLDVESSDGGAQAAEEAAAVVAAVLGWDHARRGTEVDRYRALVAAERAATAEPDDVAAAGRLAQLSSDT